MSYHVGILPHRYTGNNAFVATTFYWLQNLQGGAYSQNPSQAAQFLQQQQQQQQLAALGPTQQAALLRKVSSILLRSCL